MEPLLLIYNPTAGKGQLPDELAAVLDELRNTAVETLTPIEAMNLLYQLKQKL